MTSLHKRYRQRTLPKHVTTPLLPIALQAAYVVTVPKRVNFLQTGPSSVVGYDRRATHANQHAPPRPYPPGIISA
jgi:hypothetical protein